MAADPFEWSRRQLAALGTTLRNAVAKDPEQEVGDFARSLVDAVIMDVKARPRGDPVVDASAELVSPEMATAELPWRALDVLIVVEQLAAALPPLTRDDADAAPIPWAGGMHEPPTDWSMSRNDAPWDPRAGGR